MRVTLDSRRRLDLPIIGIVKQTLFLIPSIPPNIQVQLRNAIV